MIGYDGYKWCCHFWFVGWHCFSLGIHVDIKHGLIELHIPFGFVRIGRQANILPIYGSGWHFRKNMNW